MINRRAFCLSVGAMGVGAAWPGRAASWLGTGGAFKPTEIKSGMWALMEQGGNVLLIRTKAGPAMIDAKFVHTGPDLLGETRALAGDAPTVLINTHHHLDHTGGNWVFKKSARIIAHKHLDARIDDSELKKRARSNFEELRRGRASAAEIEAAQATLKKIETLTARDFTSAWQMSDRLDFTHGGVEMNLYHYGNGHTDNDVVIFLPEHNVLHMGDLLFHRVHPYIDRGAKANTVSWQHSVREAMKLCDDKTLVIPGHGELTDKAGLTGQIEYFDTLRKIVSEAIAAGQTKQKITLLDPPQLKDYGFKGLRRGALGAMHDELKAG